MIRKMDENTIYYFKRGLLYTSYEFFGAHIDTKRNSCLFRVYAQNAKEVYVFGDFNNWNQNQYKMQEINDTKIFELEINNIQEYTSYKYIIITEQNDVLYKADPFAFYADVRPSTNSKVYNRFKYNFDDETYFKEKKLSYDKPVLVYEMHMGSFKYTNNENEHVSYTEIKDFLIKHLKEHHFTHVEFLPIYEHPLDDSWGYMTTGYFSPTSRFGNPDQLKDLINELHKNNIGVIFDFVISHICKDAFGLYNFDGDFLYDYKAADIRENLEWGTANLDLGKGCTKSLLFSSAMYFLKEFHIDGFRIDAVSNIIYYMGNSARGENHGAIEFLKEFSNMLFDYDEKILYIAEDSTTYPNVTKRAKDYGLGFNYKWNMGYMHDTLEYFEKDPIFRKYHHDNITFGMIYNYNERFMLAYSHDEVVHLKKSLLDKMPGNYEQKFANYRTLLGLFFTFPGKKTLFMGFEIGQFSEWNFKKELDWFLLDFDMHRKLNNYVKELARIYTTESCLFEKDFNPEGFSWIDSNNRDLSIYSFYRTNYRKEKLIVIINCTPNHYESLDFGVDKMGVYQEILNSNLEIYGGYDKDLIPKKYCAFEKNTHNHRYTIQVRVPGLSVILLKFKNQKRGKKYE